MRSTSVRLVGSLESLDNPHRGDSNPLKGFRREFLDISACPQCAEQEHDTSDDDLRERFLPAQFAFEVIDMPEQSRPKASIRDTHSFRSQLCDERKDTVLFLGADSFVGTR